MITPPQIISYALTTIMEFLGTCFSIAIDFNNSFAYLFGSIIISWAIIVVARMVMEIIG